MATSSLHASSLLLPAQPGHAPPYVPSVGAMSAASAEGPHPVTLDEQRHLSFVHAPRLTFRQATTSLAYRGRAPCAP